VTTRQKTIVFASQTDPTNLAVSTNRDKSVSVYIPETVVAFRSVQLKLHVRSNATTAANLTAPTIGLQLSGGGPPMDTANLGNPVAQSGEAESWCFVRDMTTYFSTNWSGTSMTATCRCSFTGVATANHGFMLVITYDYDDTSSTHIKTIRIPVESTRTLLTTSPQTIGGTTAIPALKGSYLPEASVTVRQAWVELWGDEACTASSAATLALNYGGDTNVNCWLQTNTTINSDCWVHCIYDVTAKALTSATALNGTSLTTTNRFGNMGGMIVCTYEFDPSSTSTVYNSLLLGGFDTAGWMGGTASGDQDAWGRQIRIEEPTTITLKESAMCITMQDSGGYTFYLSAGGQTPRSFTATAGNLQSTGFSAVQRIDAGGASGGAGITLARGLNSYVGYIRSGNADAGWNAAGFLILNYTSGKSSQGIGGHNHSCHKHILNSVGSTGYSNTSSSVAPAIPESDYWLTGCMAEMFITTDNSTNGACAWNAERKAGEGEADGWEAIYTGQYRSDNENMTQEIYGAARKSWKRYPSDPDTDRMDLETARVHRIDTNPAANVGAGIWYTYHAIKFTYGGTISGSGGGTVNLYLFRDSDNEFLKSTSRSGNGAYSFDWYDNTQSLYVAAREDSTHLGRSESAVASGTP